MYFIFNLFFLLFFLFIALKIFSLFKKIIDLVISSAEENNSFKDINNSAQSDNSDQLISQELELQNIVEADSTFNDQNNEPAGLDTDSDFTAPDFSESNDLFSQFSNYSEAEKAVLYSEIMTVPKAKRNKFY